MAISSASVGFGDGRCWYCLIGGIVILRLWLFITAFVVLLGAEIHAEREDKLEDA